MRLRGNREGAAEAATVHQSSSARPVMGGMAVEDVTAVRPDPPEAAAAESLARMPLSADEDRTRIAETVPATGELDLSGSIDPVSIASLGAESVNQLSGADHSDVRTGFPPDREDGAADLESNNAMPEGPGPDARSEPGLRGAEESAPTSQRDSLEELLLLEFAEYRPPTAEWDEEEEYDEDAGGTFVFDPAPDQTPAKFLGTALTVDESVIAAQPDSVEAALATPADGGQVFVELSATLHAPETDLDEAAVDFIDRSPMATDGLTVTDARRIDDGPVVGPPTWRSGAGTAFQDDATIPRVTEVVQIGDPSMEWSEDRRQSVDLSEIATNPATDGREVVARDPVSVSDDMSASNLLDELASASLAAMDVIGETPGAPVDSSDDFFIRPSSSRRKRR